MVALAVGSTKPGRGGQTSKESLHIGLCTRWNNITGDGGRLWRSLDGGAVF